MQGFTFQTIRNILAESGASAKIGDLARDLGCQRVLLVTDRVIAEAGLLQAGLDSLARQGIAVSIFSDVVADPPETIIMAAVAAARTFRADGVISIGGGSSMDVAKLAAVLALGAEKLTDLYGVGNVKGKRLPLILAPTTAGTGSEVTPISIVTTGGDEKKGVVSPVLIPDWAVLDADLTLGLPKAGTAATGIDAMVHAIEAYTSKRLKNALSDCLARDALRLLASNIRAVCADGSNRSARQAMLLGSMLAGMAFANAPVAAVHALAYPIGARFHVAHGLSNALVLPEVLRFNSPVAAELYAEIAALILPDDKGSAQSGAEALVSYFQELPEELGLPTRLSQVGISAADVSVLARDAMKQMRLLINNPREVSMDDAAAIYGAVL